MNDREYLKREVYNGLVELFPNLYNKTIEEVFDKLDETLKTKEVKANELNIKEIG
jgi:hypothetical protein